jgi:hypothetical protein
MCRPPSKARELSDACQRAQPHPLGARSEGRETHVSLPAMSFEHDEDVTNGRRSSGEGGPAGGG